MITTKPIARDERVYANAGNPALLNLLEGEVRRVLDVGCGAGDNALLLKRRYPASSVSGVTVSPVEANVARPHLDACWVFDIEEELPDDLQEAKFDTLVQRCPVNVIGKPSTLALAHVHRAQERLV